MPRLATCLALLVAALLASACTEPTARPANETVEIAGENFRLEIAATSAARHRGLSGRAEKVAVDEGMLFVFPRPKKPSFVMRDCAAPLDLLLLDPGGRIITMHRMRVEPEGTPDSSLTRYSSRWPAQFAIELREGSIDRLELERGDSIELDLERLTRLAR